MDRPLLISALGTPFQHLTSTILVDCASMAGGNNNAGTLLHRSSLVSVYFMAVRPVHLIGVRQAFFRVGCYKVVLKCFIP